MKWKPLAREEVAIRSKGGTGVSFRSRVTRQHLATMLSISEVEHETFLSPPGAGRCLGLGHGHRDCLMGTLLRPRTILAAARTQTRRTSANPVATSTTWSKRRWTELNKVVLDAYRQLKDSGAGGIAHSRCDGRSRPGGRPKRPAGPQLFVEVTKHEVRKKEVKSSTWGKLWPHQAPLEAMERNNTNGFGVHPSAIPSGDWGDCLRRRQSRPTTLLWRAGARLHERLLRFRMTAPRYGSSLKQRMTKEGGRRQRCFCRKSIDHRPDVAVRSYGHHLHRSVVSPLYPKLRSGKICLHGATMERNPKE